MQKLYKFKIIGRSGGMADALDSGSSGSNTVWVQVPSSAPLMSQQHLLLAH